MYVLGIQADIGHACLQSRRPMCDAAKSSDEPRFCGHLRNPTVKAAKPLALLVRCDSSRMNRITDMHLCGQAFFHGLDIDPEEASGQCLQKRATC